CADLFAQRKPNRLSRRITRSCPCGARLLALTLHGGREAFGIDADSARLERILGEIERKAVGVVERKHRLPLEPVARLQRAALRIENGNAALERIAEARFLQ